MRSQISSQRSAISRARTANEQDDVRHFLKALNVASPEPAGAQASDVHSMTSSSPRSPKDKDVWNRLHKARTGKGWFFCARPRRYVNENACDCNCLLQ